MLSKENQASQETDKFQLKGSFNDLIFENTAVKVLPVEENPDNKTHKVTGFNYSKVKPTPRDNPRIVSLSAPALALLDLDKEKVEKDPDTAQYLTGNKLIPGSEPVSQCYCGHQFGSFAGQLGDGRAITLGDIRNHKGELWELQFKGSGLTPYSRFADGKAVLRSSVREYLCSEAMWALGIPTTRAASLIVTDSLAERDPLYKGDRVLEKCAVVMRLAPTLWRFGTFEIFDSAGPSYGQDHVMLKPMLDYLLINHFPEVAKLEKEGSVTRDDCYMEMFREIARKTAYLVALWQCYGFCHGVLNTDNMSVLGLTIDYGPYGWLDYFDKGHICNHSDDSGRYSYQNQPKVCKWNLIKLAEAIKGQVPLEKTTEFVETEYDKLFKQHYYAKMREKLGFYCVEREEDHEIVDNLFEIMHTNASDFTNTFRKLSSVLIPQSLSESRINQEILQEFANYSPPKDVIAARYKPHFTEAQFAKLKMMSEENMHFLMMMGISPAVIDQEEERIRKYKEAMEVDEEKVKKEIGERWQQWLKKYEQRLFKETAAVKAKTEEESKGGYSEIKMTFDSLEELQAYRIKRMNKTNPVYILRNYMAEEAIKKAEAEDFSGVNNLLELVLNPFDQKEGNYESKEYKKCPPKWAADICVSCSS